MVGLPVVFPVVLACSKIAIPAAGNTLWYIRLSKQQSRMNVLFILPIPGSAFLHTVILLKKVSRIFCYWKSCHVTADISRDNEVTILIFIVPLLIKMCNWLHAISKEAGFVFITWQVFQYSDVLSMDNLISIEYMVKLPVIFLMFMDLSVVSQNASWFCAHKRGQGTK